MTLPPERLKEVALHGTGPVVKALALVKYAKATGQFEDLKQRIEELNGVEEATGERELVKC